MTPTPARSILVVDDDAAIREGLAEFLAEEGFAVHTAQNGRDAIDWLHRADAPPNVVLLDLMMPVMDGQEFLQVRQDDPVLSRIPVVLITADHRSAEGLKTESVAGICPKPLALDGLLETIDGCE